jgi:hypothetical protein
MLHGRGDAIARSSARRSWARTTSSGVFNRKVQEEVAKAVSTAAAETGSARRRFFLGL